MATRVRASGLHRFRPIADHSPARFIPRMSSALHVLAFDSSTEWLSVALDLGDGAVLASTEPGGARASQRLLPLVQELLAEAGLRLRDIGLIGFGAGPGAFTGLRAACAAAQGLAFGLDIPVVPVHTLLAVAASAEGSAQTASTLLVANDARMGELYWALTQQGADGDWRLSAPVQVAPPQAAAAAWVQALGDVPPAGLQLLGHAWAEHGAALAAALPAAWHALLDEALTVAPKAAAVARLARAAHARGESVAAAQALPIYVRNKVALTTEERERARRVEAAHS